MDDSARSINAYKQSSAPHGAPNYNQNSVKSSVTVLASDKKWGFGESYGNCRVTGHIAPSVCLAIFTAPSWSLLLQLTGQVAFLILHRLVIMVGVYLARGGPGKSTYFATSAPKVGLPAGLFYFGGA